MGRWGLLALVGVALAVAPPAAARPDPPLHKTEVRRLVTNYMRDAQLGQFVVGRCRVGHFHAWCRTRYRGVIGFEPSSLPRWWGDTINVDAMCGRRVIWSTFFDDNPWNRRRPCS